MTQPLRILIADDSALAREFLSDLFKGFPEVDIIGQVENGKQAVQFCKERRPDLVMMDVEMPEMDGIEATSRIMSSTPTPILIFSSISRSSLSFKAVQAGAVEVMEKPSLKEIDTWRKDVRSFIRKLQMFSRIKVVRHLRPKHIVEDDIREPDFERPGLVVVGASTGGPQALNTMFSGLGQLPFPIVVVQHMTKGFLRGLVTWIESNCHAKVVIAEDGMVLCNGTIYFAPEDFFTLLSAPRQLRVTRDLPKWTEHRPCVNYLFQSAAKIRPADTLGILLTGMGKDGAEGLLELKRAGGRTVTQDEASCMIYGMPREAEQLGASDRCLSPVELNRHLANCAGGKA